MYVYALSGLIERNGIMNTSNTFRRMTAAVLCLTAVTALTACSDKTDISSSTSTSSTQQVIVTKTSSTQAVAEQTPPENVSTIAASANSAQKYKDIEVTISNPSSVEYNISSKKILIFDISILNTSAETYSANAMSNFEISVDGEVGSTSYLNAQVAAMAANKTGKTVFGSSTDAHPVPISQNETGTGILPVLVPEDFKEVTISFLPDGAQSTEKLTYKFTSKDVVE